MALAMCIERASIAAKRFVPLFLLVLSCSAINLAHACTVCKSNTAHQVRTGIFQNRFRSTLFQVMLPFPILAAAIMLLVQRLSVPEKEKETAL